MKKLLTILCLVLLSSYSYSYSEDIPYETFYENNQLESKGNYIDGTKDGVWERFDDNGQVERNWYFLMGKKVSKRKYFKQRPNEKL